MIVVVNLPDDTMVDTIQVTSAVPGDIYVDKKNYHFNKEFVIFPNVSYLDAIHRLKDKEVENDKNSM